MDVVRRHWRISLKYLLILLAVVVILAAAVPALRETIETNFQETGILNLNPAITLMVGLLFLGILAAMAIAMTTIFKRKASLNTLTNAARALGEGEFENIAIPDDPSGLPEIRELSAALNKTAAQTESHFSALNAERAMLSTVLSQMTDGVLIADRGGRVQLLNRAAEKLFKISNEKALGRSIVEVMRHHNLIELWEASQEGDPQTITLEMGADHRFLQVVGIPMESELPGRTMLLFQDLTQTHRLETVRRDFISNISHELRTPMAGLKAISETLLDGALDDRDVARRFVVRMDSEVDNLTHMVNELLELSRIEGGRSSFEFQRVRPLELMIKPLERMRLQAERSNLKFTWECPDNLPEVFADPDRIAQVFTNLVHNAIKFTPPGGSIHVGAWVHDQDVVFMVRDNGVGVPAEDQPRIFERFYKADRARTGGGTGLGLSISKHMVEAHSGRIWVESEEGHGSSFFFTIPIVLE